MIGAAIIGGIAAIVSSNNRRERERDVVIVDRDVRNPDWRDDDRRYDDRRDRYEDRRDDRYDGRYDDRRGAPVRVMASSTESANSDW